MAQRSNPPASSTARAGRAGPTAASPRQAACLHPLLLRKVQAWARASGGGFPLASGRGYMAYARAAEADPAPELKFARVKSVPRAIEKVVRAYTQVRGRRAGDERGVVAGQAGESGRVHLAGGQRDGEGVRPFRAAVCEADVHCADCLHGWRFQAP